MLQLDLIMDNLKGEVCRDAEVKRSVNEPREVTKSYDPTLGSVMRLIMTSNPLIILRPDEECK